MSDHKRASESQRKVLVRLDEPYHHQVPRPDPIDSDVLRVSAFNLHQGRKILQILGALLDHPDLKEAHVVALQEVDRFNGRTGGLDLSGLITRETGKDSVYGVEFIELQRRSGSAGGDHGNQTLSVLPVRNARIIRLPVAFDWTRSKTQPRLGTRMALSVETLFQDRWIRIINAHLENQCLARQRLDQLRFLLDREQTLGEPMPAILLGDMNTFMFREPIKFRQAAAKYGYHDALPIRPRGTWGRFFRLDWILVRGFEVRASGICRDVTGSDHKPVWAELELPRR